MLIFFSLLLAVSLLAYDQDLLRKFDDYQLVSQVEGVWEIFILTTVCCFLLVHFVVFCRVA